jgi:hypothetical protein
MRSLFIEGTHKSPEISADADQGLVEIKGRSHPENTAKCYWPLMDWAEKYVKAPREKTTISINLEYFNTSSSKVILNILRKFEAIPDAKERVTVNWYYEANDEDDLETGEYLGQMTNLGFKFIGI